MSIERTTESAPETALAAPANPSLSRQLFALISLLLVIFASRVIRLSTLEMDPDEVWSVWQTFGSPSQIIKWTPYDWTPLYYLIVGAWRWLTGLNPFVLRLLSLYTFLIAMALLYRLARRFYGPTAALIAVAACAALGFAINISLMLRAYGMLFCAAILAWWLAIRYFHRPTVMRGVILGVVSALLFYLHFTGIFAVGMVGLYTLVIYRRKVWRWWLPALVMAILILPEVIGKLGAAGGKADVNGAIMAQWLAGGATILLAMMRQLIIDYAGYNFILWAVLMVIAAFLIFDQYRASRRSLALALWVVAPAFLFVMGYFGGYTNRHTTWLMAAFAIWIGAGLKFLPRAAILGVLAMFVVIMFTPVPFERYKTVNAPLVTTFEWLAPQVESDDVMIIDPDYTEIAPEEWDYFTRAYFPNGLDYVNTPGEDRRVWYIYGHDKPDKTMLDQIAQNRVSLAKYGTQALTVELYEAPPDITGVAYPNGLRFHGAEALDANDSPIPVWREGQSFKMRMWWSTDKALTGDLSVGTYVFNGANKLAEFDGPPQLIDGPQQTSQWQPGQLYVEERTMNLQYPIDMADYTVQMTVYQSWDGTRFNPPGHTDALLPILQFHIMSWSSPHNPTPQPAN